MPTFGERFRALRKRSGKTAKDFAAEVGVSPQYINDIEKGRRNPPSDGVINDLAYALGTHADWLHLAAGRLPPTARDLTDDQMSEILTYLNVVLGNKEWHADALLWLMPHLSEGVLLSAIYADKRVGDLVDECRGLAYHGKTCDPQRLRRLLDRIAN